LKRRSTNKKERGKMKGDGNAQKHKKSEGSRVRKGKTKLKKCVTVEE
jgi:hypothetical protein